MSTPRPERNADPIVQRSETWRTSLSPELVRAKLQNAFGDRRYRVQSTDSELKVETGSRTLYRLWGELIPWGKNNAPVGLMLVILPTASGTEVKASAFDRFGWRLTNKTFFGADETLTSKIDQMIKLARSASEAPD